MVKAMDAIFKPVTVEFGQVHIAGASGVEASRRTGQNTIHARGGEEGGGAGEGRGCGLRAMECGVALRFVARLGFCAKIQTGFLPKT